MRRACGILAAGSLLGAALTACVRPDEDHSAQPTCVAPGVTADQIKVGMLYPLTGPFETALSAFRGGVDARFGVENEKGGVNGRRLVYDWLDDASSPGENLVSARQLVDVHNVFGILEGSTVAYGSADYLDSEGVPVVGISLEPSWTEHDNMFAFTHYVTHGRSISTWGEYVQGEGGTRAAVLMPSLTSSYALLSEKIAASLQAANIEVALDEEVTVGLTDVTALVERMKQAGVDTITGALTPQLLAAVVPAARAGGLNLKVVLSPSGYDPTLLTLLGHQLAGTSFFIHVMPFELDLPAHRTLLAAMVEYSPQIQPPSRSSAVVGWLSADMLIRGIEAAGDCLTRENFITSLRNVSDYNGGGLIPQTVNFKIAATELDTCYQFVQISADGESFIPKPGLRCGEPIG